MEIIIGKTAGFCFGVANAVNKTRDIVEKQKKAYCLGELVHNAQVIEEFEKQGLKIIDNVQDAEGTVIIRAHGTTKQVYEEAEKAGLHIEDFTCPKVLAIHKIVEAYVKENKYIFVIGAKDHPETIGTKSFCGKYVSVIEKEEDVEQALQEFYHSPIKKLAIVAQTTYSLEKFRRICHSIQNLMEDKQDYTLEIKETICDATRLRQEEIEEMAKKVDRMIIIGGKHSSNTNKLYEIAKKHCPNSILIETYKELSVEEEKKYASIGIMAGASTPQKSIDEVVKMLQN